MHALLPKLGRPSLAAASAAAARAPSLTPSVAALCQQGAGWSFASQVLRYGANQKRSRAATVSAVASQPSKQQQGQQDSAEEAFYAEAAENFEELGIVPSLAEALREAGFARPSRVQELVVPKILTGKDIVLAAETGSGKTLAYIAPLSSLLLQKAEAGQMPPTAELLAQNSDSSRAQDNSGYKPKLRPPARWMGLVLCPNTALCHQVVRLVSSLQGPSGLPLLTACHVSSSRPPPFDSPDIVVTTPGALKTLFDDRGAMYGSAWTAEAVALRAAWVVVDEADLLWQGGYVKDLTRLLDAFKAAERRVMEAQVLRELGLDKSALGMLPRNVTQALWKGGVPAMKKAGLTQPQIERMRSQPRQQPASSAQDAAEFADAYSGSSSGSSSSADDNRVTSSQGTSTSGSSSGQYGPYNIRQHLFVAATMPALTKGDVGTELQKRFAGALWVSGDMLHQVKPQVDHTWVKIGDTADEVDDVVLSTVQEDPDYKAGKARVLVFTANTANADRVSNFLSGQGVPNYVYHKNLPVKDQAAALAAMAHPAPGDNLVMVSTDAAARGIDLPEVTHVIQADFVANAIDFLHRVGRTARAGRSGKVASLYGRDAAGLAEAVRQYVEEGRPVADCFSRNRSFSKKMKRYGKFVPRGVEGPQGDV